MMRKIQAPSYITVLGHMTPVNIVCTEYMRLRNQDRNFVGLPPSNLNTLASFGSMEFAS